MGFMVKSMKLNFSTAASFIPTVQTDGEFREFSENVSYNRSALTFREAGRNNTANCCRHGVNAFIAISANNKLRLLCSDLPLVKVPIAEQVYCVLSY
jgi:hypothetical protein